MDADCVSHLYNCTRFVGDFKMRDNLT